MKNLNVFILVIAFLAISSCAEKKADEAAISRWHKAVEEAVNNADYDAYSSLWADDMIWMPPNMRPMHGKQECLKMAKGGFENFHIEQKVTIEEIVVSGDIAFTRVSSLEKMTAKGDTVAMINDGKNIFTFRRGPDGSWLGVHCIWNSNISPEASAKWDELLE